MSDDKKWLYGKFTQGGLNVGSYEDFDKSLSNEEDRKWYHEKATKMGLNVGSYDDFSSLFSPNAPAADSVKEDVAQAEQTDRQARREARREERQARKDAKRGSNQPPAWPDDDIIDIGREPGYRTLAEEQEEKARQVENEPGYQSPLQTETDPNALRRQQQARRDISNPEYFENVSEEKAQSQYLADKYRGQEQSARERQAGLKGDEKREAKAEKYEAKRLADLMQKAADLNPEYQKELDARNEELDRIGKQIDDMSNALVGDAELNVNLRQSPFYNSPLSKMAGTKEGRNLLAAENLVDEARTILNRGNRYTDEKDTLKYYGEAHLEKLSSPEFWTLGLSKISDGKRIREVLEKAQKQAGTLSKDDLEAGNLDKILTPDEMAVMDAWLAWSDAQILRAYDQSKGYKGGEISADAVAFMRDMALTAGISGEVNAALKTLFNGWTVKAGSLLNKFGVRAGTELTGLGGKALHGWATESGLNAAQKLGRGALDYSHKVVKNLVAAGLDSAVAVNFTPTLYANYSKQLITPDGNNLLRAKDEVWNENWWQNWKEYFTERGIGAGPGESVGYWTKQMGAKQIAGKLAGTKVARLATQFSRSVRTGKMATLGAFNMAEEPFEELVGAAMDKYIFKDKGALTAFWEPENLGTMMGGFAPLMGIQAVAGGVNVYALNRADRRYQKQKENLKFVAKKYGVDLSDTAWERYFSYFDTKVSHADAAQDIDITGAEMVEQMSKFTNLVAADAEENGLPMSQQEQEQFLETMFSFYKSAVEQITVQGAYEYQQAEKRQAKRDEIQQSLGWKQFWTDVEGEDGYVILIETADGNTAYGRIISDGGEEPDSVPVVFQDGTTGYVRRNDIVSRQNVRLQEYLDQQVKADQAAADEQAMAEQRQAQVEQLAQQFEVGVRNDALGLTPTDIGEDGVDFMDDKGTPVSMTWEQIGKTLGQPITTATEEELAGAQAGADAKTEDDAAALEIQINAGLKKKSLIQDEQGETWNIVKVLPGTIDQESGTAHFLLKNGKGDYWETTLSYDEFINPDMSEPAEVTGQTEGAGETEVQEPAAPEEPQYEVPKNEAGETDYNKMLEENPAAYAAELEKALGAEGREVAKQFIGEKIKAINKEAEAALKKMDTNKVVSLRSRAKQYQDVLDSLANPVAEAAPEIKKKEVPTFARLLGDGLGFSDIKRYVERQIERITGLRDSLEQPVFDGENLEKWEKDKAQYDENIAQANGLLNHFAQMKSVIDRVEQAVPGFEEAQARELTDADLEPQDGTELAAQMFSGGYYLTIDSYNHELIARGRGASGQTGENKAMIGLFRKPENGGHTIPEAAERLIEMRDEGYSGASFADEDARDIIIDLLAGVRTYQELKDYIATNRRAQFQEEAEYANGAMAKEIMDRYGKTVEEFMDELDGLRLAYLSQLLEKGEEFTNFEQNEKGDGSVPETETNTVLPPEQGGAEQGDTEGAGVVQAGESADETVPEAPGEPAGQEGDDSTSGVLAGPEGGESGVGEPGVGDMPEFGEEPPVITPEAPQEAAAPELTPADIVEVYNNREKSKAADKGKRGRIEILKALYEANPELVQFRNDQDQANAISDVVELARKYPDLEISKEILSRIKGTPETEVAEEAPAAESPAAEKPETGEIVEEKPENQGENTSESPEKDVTSQEKGAKSPASLTSVEEAREYFEGLYGKGKRADNSVRVWELTHKKAKPQAQGENGMQAMAMPVVEGITEDEAAELQVIGTQLAVDYIETDGLVKFPAFFKNLVETFGENIRPFAKSIYLGAAAYVSDEVADQMDDRKAVRDFDETKDINDTGNEQDTDTVAEQPVGEPAGDTDGGASGEGEPGTGGISETGGESGGPGSGNEEGESAPDVSGGDRGSGERGGEGVSEETGGKGGRTSDSGRGRGGRGSGTRTGGTGRNTGGIPGVQDGGRGPIGELKPTEEQLSAAEQKAYETAKETWKDSEDIASLKSLNESLKQLIEAEEGDSIQKRQRMGERKAVLERLREIFAQQNIKPTDISQEKTQYVPSSDPEGKHAIGSVVPSGAVDAMRDAIKKLEEEEGKSVAEFVKDELGYKSLEEMFSDYDTGKDTGLASEQVDSVGLAIHQMKKGKMFIVGDMTGVGKGRQGAALIRWAKKNKKKCLFVTENSGLFSDMYGDMTDIGSGDLLPFIVNNDRQANITDKNGVKIISHPSAAERTALFQSEDDKLPFNKKFKKNYDFVMMTYSQAQAGEGSKMNTKTKQKLDWLKNYAKDAIIIMDESHNAGGDSNRGKYFRNIVLGASGVTFMSATYAKRPDNMVLYALRSSIGETNMTLDDLIEAIQDFGIPMQEILASNLFKTGEMVRRERDFSDVKTNWPDAKETFSKEEYEECRKTSDKTVSVINSIIDFQRAVVYPTIKKMNEQFEDHNKQVMLMGNGWVKEYRNTSYAGQVSNVVGLMLYDMKARKAAEMAIELIKKGEKPVIAVENTLGSYIDKLGGDFAELEDDDENEGVVDKDTFKNANFSEVLRKGLESTLRYTLVEKQYKDHKPVPKEDGGIKKQVFTSIESELDGPGKISLRQTFDVVDRFRDDTDKMELPLSPIDYIKETLAAAGYTCGEITGRKTGLARNPDGTFSKIPIKVDKKAFARKFNGGTVNAPLKKEETLDALILNVAGATGISLHASKRAGDQRKRDMIILQPARDVNTEVQMRGRVDRTGQVSRAEYFYITSPIPAEQKLTMMLRRKLASLDANSVGTEDVSSNRVDAEDMDNKYGDQVAEQFLLEHLQDINSQLDDGLKFNNKTKEWEGHEGLLYDVLKGMQRMSCEDQETILAELQNRYVERIEYLNQNGINDLKTTTMNLDAQTIDVGVFVKGKDNDSPSMFAHDTNIERVEVNVLKKPLRSDDINKKMKQLGALDSEGKLKFLYGDDTYTSASADVEDMKKKRKEKHQESEEKLLKKLRTQYNRAVDQTEEDYEKQLRETTAFKELQNKNSQDYVNYEAELIKQTGALKFATENLKPGKPYLVPLTDDISNTAPMMYGRFIGFKTKGGKPRGVKAIFAVKDSRAMIDVPVVTMESTIRKIVQETFSSIGINDIGGTSWRLTDEDRRPKWDEWWDKMIPKNTSRQIRYMVTGNVLQACGSLGKHKGTITTFTRKDKETGEVTTDKGMLLAEDFDPENFKVRSKVTKDDVWKSYNAIKDEATKISVWRSRDEMFVKFSKRKGEKLADHPINKDEDFKKLIVEDKVEAYSRDELFATVKEENVEAALEHLFKNYGFTREHLFVMPDSTERVDAIVYTGKPYQQVIDELGNKYGIKYKFQVENELSKSIKTYKMDVNNEELKDKIRELVQLRQAFYRKDSTKEESSRLAWRVLSYDQSIENAGDDKGMRDYAYNMREAVLEELAERGVQGTEMHYEQGKKSVDEIRKIFDGFNKDAENIPIADKVFKLISQLGMDLVLSEKIDANTGGQTAGKVVEYNWKFFNAKWITDQLKANTILHELVHTVTVYAKRAIDEGYEHLLSQDIIDAVTELDGIYREIATDDAFKHETYEDYGVSNWFEMMSEAGSNSLFRDDLRKVPLVMKNKSGFITFYNAKKNQGIQGKPITAYDAVMERLNILIDNFSKDAFENYFRGTGVGDRYRTVLGEDGFVPTTPEELDEHVERLVHREDEPVEHPISTPVERAEAVEKVQALASRFGIEVGGDSSIPAKGQYDPNTGKILVNYDRHDSLEDVEQTVFHEAVGHYGLAKLFGDDFNNLLLDVYAGAHDIIREEIDSIREKMGRGASVADATEEYLAILAENGVNGSLEMSLWQRIKQSFFGLLRKIGLNIPVTDEDLMYLLWQSKRNLENTGHLSIFELADRALMRDALRRQAESSHNPNPEDSGPFDGGGRRYRQLDNPSENANLAGVGPAALTDLYKDMSEGGITSDVMKSIFDLYEHFQSRRFAQFRYDRGAQEGLRRGGPHLFAATLIQRGSEGAVSGSEDIRGGSEKEGGRRALDLLREYASKMGVWYDSTGDYIKNRLGPEAYPLDSGAESDVYRDEEKGTAIKTMVVNGAGELRASDLDKITLYNAIFPETAYEVVGFGGDGNFGTGVYLILEQKWVSRGDPIRPITEYVSKDGRYYVGDANKFMTDLGFVPVRPGDKDNTEYVSKDGRVHIGNLNEFMTDLGFRPEYVFSRDIPESIPLQSEIESFMTDLGFVPVRPGDKDNTEYVSKDGRYYVGDLHTLNVIKLPDGGMRVIDANVGFNSVEFGVVGIDNYNPPDPSSDLVAEPTPIVRYRSLRHKPSNPRIRRQIVRQTTVNEENDEALRLYNRAANSVFTRLSESFVDMYRSLVSAKEAIEKESGKKAKDSEDFVAMFNTLSSRMHAMSSDFAGKQFKAMREAISAITDEFEDVEFDDVSKYVSIKSGLERNIELAKRDAREWYQAEAEKLAEKIRSDKKLSDTEKQDKLDALYAELEERIKDVNAGTDEKFLEYRKDDYGGITGWMSEYTDAAGNPIDELPGMEPNESVEEYNARIRSMRHPIPGAETLEGAEGLAQMYVSDFENKVGAERCDKLWHTINDCTKHILRTQYKSNVISKAQFDSLIDRLQFYVPLRGFSDETAGDIYTYYNSDERKSFTPPLLRAGGRMSVPDSPFGYIASMADSAFSEAAKNDAKRSLFRFVQARKDNSFITVADSYYRDTKQSNGKGGTIWQAVNPYTEIDPLTGKPFITDGMSIKAERDAMKRFKEAMLADQDVVKGKKNLGLRNSVAMITDKESESHIVRVKVLGDEYEMVFHGNPRMAQAINGELNSDSSDNAFKKFLRWLASMSTSRNPAFWVDNFRRDFVTSLVNLTATENAEYRSRYEANLKYAIRAIQLYMNEGKLKGANDVTEKGRRLSEVQAMWKSFIDNGGVTGMTVISRHDQVDATIRKFLKTGYYNGADASILVRNTGAIGEMFKKAGDFGESIEQIIRFATFMTSRQMGRGVNESISNAKEVTVNFNRKGSGRGITMDEAKTLGYSLPNGKWHKLSKPEQLVAVLFSQLSPVGRNMYLFFNANMQGLYRQVQNFKKGPAQTAAMMAGLAAMGFAYTIIADMFGGGDDDEKEYFRISEYNRGHKFKLPAFWNEDLFFLWPIPPEFAPFYEIGNIWADNMLKRRPDQNPVWASLRVMGEVLPANPMEPNSLIPAQVKPVVESIANQNYMGYSIYNKNQANKDMPGYTKAYDNTWGWLTDLSEWTNTISGGDYATKGWANFNPAVAQHIIEGIGGGLLTLIGQTVTTATNIATGKPAVLRTTPFLNRFALDTDEYMRDSYITKEYQYFKSIADETGTRLTRYRYNKPDEDYLKVEQVLNSKEFRYYELYKDYKKEIKQYQDEINAEDDLVARKQLMEEQDAIKRAFVDECMEIFYSKE